MRAEKRVRYGEREDKRLVKMLRQKAHVLFINEYHTSKRCSRCAFTTKEVKGTHDVGWAISGPGGKVRVLGSTFTNPYCTHAILF